jgi:hypothetical protein
MTRVREGGRGGRWVAGGDGAPVASVGRRRLKKIIFVCIVVQIRFDRGICISKSNNRSRPWTGISKFLQEKAAETTKRKEDEMRGKPKPLEHKQKVTRQKREIIISKRET